MALHAAEAALHSIAAAFDLYLGESRRAGSARPQVLPAGRRGAVRALIPGEEAGAFLRGVVNNHLRRQGSSHADPHRHQY
jgi:hypothetical protein